MKQFKLKKLKYLIVAIYFILFLGTSLPTDNSNDEIHNMEDKTCPPNYEELCNFLKQKWPENPDLFLADEPGM